MASSKENDMSDRNLRYDKPWNAAFDVTLTRLSDSALNLFYILAFLSPEAVPESMIFSVHNDSDLLFLSGQSKLSMVAELRDGQLVSRETINGDLCLTTHRSLQHAILHKLNQETFKLHRPLSFTRAFKLLQAVLPQASDLQQPDDITWPAIEKHLPDIESLEAAWNRTKPEFNNFIQLVKIFSQFGVDLYHRGLIKVGEKLMKSAEVILDSVAFNETIDMRANIHISIGMYTDTLGITRRDEGLKRRNQALELRRKALEGRTIDSITTNEDILLHNAVMDLSCSNQQFNRFDKVEELSNICFKKFRAWGSPGKFPYEYAKYYHSMNFVFVYRRQMDLAVKFAKVAADLMLQARPGTLIATVYKFDWAVSLFQAGKVAEAIKAHEEILEIRLERCGKSNPLTLQSYLTLGIMNYFKHNYVSAESWIRKVFINHKKAYWPRENLARASFYFSLILGASKDLPSPGLPSNASLLLSYSSHSRRKTLEKMSREHLAHEFHAEASTVLDELLPEDRRAALKAEMKDPETAEAVLYDYMAPWGYRVVVQQVPNYQEALILCQPKPM